MINIYCIACLGFFYTLKVGIFFTVYNNLVHNCRNKKRFSNCQRTARCCNHGSKAWSTICIGQHMLAKWNSVGNYIINIHSGHSQLFFACEHAELAGRDRQKRWLKPGIKHIHFKKEKKKRGGTYLLLIVLFSIGQYFSSLKLFYISESKYLNIFQLVI